MTAARGDFDVIVIGSGVGGLTAAAALAKSGRRVLVLEQHFVLGGLTQTFSRRGHSFATGVHEIGGMGETAGPDNRFGRLLRWLTDDRLQFAPIEQPYDIVRLPGLEFPVEAPLAKYVERLKVTFPGEAAAIDAYFLACDEARQASTALLMTQGLPLIAAAPTRWLHARQARRALEITSAAAVRDIQDKRLAALLMARWGDYGMPPQVAPFAVHALVMGSYFDGAYYPVGGPAKFAEELGATVRAAGGELRARTTVAEICIADGRATGVRTAKGETITSSQVISAAGARNTVAMLPAGVAQEWRIAVESLASGLSYVSLYVGLKGDIRQHGATPANVWIYEADSIGDVWTRPADEDAPHLVVTFPTLKDPAHIDTRDHVAEIMVICRWEPFAAWADSRPRHRPEDYNAFKARIADRLLTQFKRHFPRLVSLIDFSELSTPLSQAAFVRADRGAMYGLEMSARRMQHRALRTRTPVQGLYLGGQDAASPGIQGALIGGFMAAAAIEPRLWMELRR